MGRERHYKQTSLACAGSGRSAWTTLGLPSSPWRVFSGSTVLKLQAALQVCCPKQALPFVFFPALVFSGSGSWVLHKATDSVGHAFCALPRSEQIRQPGAWWVHLPRRAVCVSHLWGPSCWVSQVRWKCTVSVVPVSPLGSWSQAVTLLADVNHPGSQEDAVSNWEPANTWWKMQSLGPRLQQPMSSSSGCCKPASLPPGAGQGLYTASWLSFGICSILCSVHGPGCGLEPFMGEFSLSLFFSPL